QQPELVALGLLVPLRPADEQAEALLALGDVLDVEGDELAAPERAGEPDQEQGPVPHADQAVEVQGGDHRPEVRCDGRLLLGGVPTLGAADALPYESDAWVLGRVLEAGLGVVPADGREPAR